MIPVLGTDISDVEIVTLPSLSYKMNLEAETIVGKCDDLETMKQVIYKILNTERYQYVIYSYNYGIELVELFGQPMSYVMPELERRIKEALLQDDRIQSVDSFEFDTSKRHELVCRFTARTIFGDIELVKGVNY